MAVRNASTGRKIIFSSLFGALLLCMGWFAMPQRAHAEYVQHNLIDDNLFLDAASMSAADIQTFLNARGGYIANYYSWSDRDGADVSAARIIYEAAQDYGISPKVLLATMQKEQSLVTAKNPTASQLNFAMGYGCPDSTGCGTSYKGFYKQVDNASWQLRYNFERARGNNTWWRNSSSYACGGTTRYYSTGLYVGRYVTFYDEVGTGYVSFTLNNASTASMYCYTPHAYPGSAAKYYSGSYNFVVAYENWFGSTQPTAVIASPLRLATTREGVFTNTPVTLSFDIRNNTNATIDVGSMMIAVRDELGNNYDFGLKPMTVGAWGTATYSASTTLPREGTYRFWITNYSNGYWRDGYPVSSYIDNARSISGVKARAMPTITQQPTAAGGTLRKGKTTQVGFTVRNNSAQSMDLGRLGLAVRGPEGQNSDLPFNATGAIAPGASYVYSESFTPRYEGTYRMFIGATVDNGQTWSDGSYPAAAPGQQSSVLVPVKPSPTVTAGVAVGGGATTHSGQVSPVTFQVTNQGDAPVTVGRLGVTVRSPSGANRDPRWDDVTIAAGQTYSYSANVVFDEPGTWTVNLTNYRGDLGWNAAYPVSEDASVARAMPFQVKDNPLVTTAPTITPASPRVGQTATVSYTITNAANRPVTTPLQGLAVRDAHQNNLDAGWEEVTIPANGTYTYTKQVTFRHPGIARAWLAGNRGGWTTAYPLTAAQVGRSVEATVLPSPTLITGVSASPNPTLNQSSTLSFSVKNYGNTPVSVGLLGLSIRDPQGANRDPRWDDVTIQPGATYTYSVPLTFDKPGKWSISVVNYEASRGWNALYPVSENDAIVRVLAPTL